MTLYRREKLGIGEVQAVINVDTLAKGVFRSIDQTTLATGLMNFVLQIER